MIVEIKKKREARIASVVKWGGPGMPCHSWAKLRYVPLAAAQAGDVARVRELMAQEEDARPDGCVPSSSGRRRGETPLVAAIRSGVADNCACLRALLLIATGDQQPQADHAGRGRPTIVQSAKDEALLEAAKYGRVDYMRMAVFVLLGDDADEV